MTEEKKSKQEPEEKEPVKKVEPEDEHAKSLIEVEVGKAIVDIQEMVEQAEKQVIFLERIKRVSIKNTNYRDWINHNNNPYLEISGTMKINQLWGVSIVNQKHTIEAQTDEKGLYKIVTVSGTAKWRGYEIADIGTCTTRDQFFGKKAGELKELADVNLEDVIKAATTNFHNRILKKILGLKFTWEDLKAEGMDIEKIKGRAVTHAGKGEALTDEEKSLQVKLGNMIMEIENGDKEKASGYLKIVSAYSYKHKKTGKQTKVEGVGSCSDLRGNRLKVVYGKVKDIYEEWKKSIGGENK